MLLKQGGLVMKLDKELKEKIDRYFDNISAENLYSILTEKYNFVDNDSDTVIVNNGKYSCMEDMVSEFMNDIMFYSDLDFGMNVEVVKMKFLEDILGYHKEEIVCDNSCSIPLAA